MDQTDEKVDETINATSYPEPGFMTSVQEPVNFFLCFAPFVFLRSIVLTSLFPLFYVTCEYLTARMSPEYFGSLVSGDSVALFSRSKKLKEKSITESQKPLRQN